jgi:hypothetical protein
MISPQQWKCLKEVSGSPFLADLFLDDDLGQHAEFLVLSHHLVELSFQTKQLLAVAPFHNASLLEDPDLVVVEDVGDLGVDADDGGALQLGPQDGLDDGVGSVVDAREGFVQDEQGPLFEEDSGHADQLLLAETEVDRIVGQR